jgi:hypothetical protein
MVDPDERPVHAELLGRLSQFDRLQQRVGRGAGL